MGGWILVGLGTVGVGIFARLMRRPPRDERVVVVRLHPVVRMASAVILTGIYASALVLGIMAVASSSWQDAAFDRSDGIAVALLIVVAVAGFQVLLKHADIIGTEKALYVFGVGIPWDSVEDIEYAGRILEVTTPRLRRAWNGWSGVTTVPLIAWQVTPDLLAGLEGLFERSKSKRISRSEV